MPPWNCAAVTASGAIDLNLRVFQSAEVPVLEAVSAVRQSGLVLVEGGPQLMGDFFAEHCLDELFLTLAPQLAGRDSSGERPGLVAGKRSAPEHPIWGTLVSVKRGGNHLFLRYTFEGAG